ncbi:MAG: nitroreductase family protein [Actinomycetota bacterium]|nr:nitroreductase family protein [Actinomycetota bacterium]
MDAYQAIVTKRDTRSFSPEPVADGDLQRILQAGRMAGSAKNQQLNRIVVVTDADDREALAECGRFADWIPSAPVVAVIVVPKEGGKAFDIGRMAQNMMVAAQGMGLASCPVTFHHEDCVREHLGFPDDHEAPMGIGFGHPAPAADKKESAPRIPLDELVDWGRWSA